MRFQLPIVLVILSFSVVAQRTHKFFGISSSANPDFELRGKSFMTGISHPIAKSPLSISVYAHYFSKRLNSASFFAITSAALLKFYTTKKRGFYVGAGLAYQYAKEENSLPDNYTTNTVTGAYQMGVEIPIRNSLWVICPEMNLTGPTSLSSGLTNTFSQLSLGLNFFKQSTLHPYISRRTSADFKNLRLDIGFQFLASGAVFGMYLAPSWKLSQLWKVSLNYGVDVYVEDTFEEFVTVILHSFAPSIYYHFKKNPSFFYGGGIGIYEASQIISSVDFSTDTYTQSDILFGISPTVGFEFSERVSILSQFHWFSKAVPFYNESFAISFDANFSIGVGSIKR